MLCVQHTAYNGQGATNHLARLGRDDSREASKFTFIVARLHAVIIAITASSAKPQAARSYQFRVTNSAYSNEDWPLRDKINLGLHLVVTQDIEAHG